MASDEMGNRIARATPFHSSLAHPPARRLTRLEVTGVPVGGLAATSRDGAGRGNKGDSREDGDEGGKGKHA